MLREDRHADGYRWKSHKVCISFVKLRRFLIIYDFIFLNIKCLFNLSWRARCACECNVKLHFICDFRVSGLVIKKKTQEVWNHRFPQRLLLLLTVTNCQWKVLHRMLNCCEHQNKKAAVNSKIFWCRPYLYKLVLVLRINNIFSGLFLRLMGCLI